ncbi:hypothetical protein HLK59_27760 [Streptomyces sp. S3(2020)]|uniref:hypothetical protein n=1 Tax=Streptomyces sp. S3(2020) TaxID=2732044 RepID=UPI0014888097|nr:hypothetical protein [Streptomyces sp. S3(2020)]NNN34092.1 hypothetical protein [Streptomyces sp. S3(2020)]
MPRRRPSAVRAATPIRIRRSRQPRFGRISAGCAADIRRLEHRRFSPGETDRVFRYWAALAHGPFAHLTRDVDTCGIPECGCDPGYTRDHLEQVLRALPTKSARELRALLDELDAVILRRARVLPYSSPDVPWWWEWWF